MQKKKRIIAVLLCLILIPLAIILKWRAFPAAEEQKPLTASLFFGNRIFDPLGMDCREVFAVERNFPGADLPKETLEALLMGPTEQELERGYISRINFGSVINSFSVKDGVAQVDFNEQFNNAIAGSCLVLHIRSEIETTLKQFPNIKDVEISVMGKTEGVLQP